MTSAPPIRRRRFGRLLLVIPLIAVLGLWVASFGRYDAREVKLGQTRYRLISTDGRLQLDRQDARDVSSDPNKFVLASRVMDIPYWSVWAVVAAITVYFHLTTRKPITPTPEHVSRR